MEDTQQCLPCHDLVVRDVEAEITFTEWNRIPGFSMFGGISCQSCHMPEKEDGTHDHNFIGVDLDLGIAYLENPLFEKVSDMLESSVEMSFDVWGQYLPESISIFDTLYLSGCLHPQPSILSSPHLFTLEHNSFISLNLILGCFLRIF